MENYKVTIVPPGEDGHQVAKIQIEGNITIKNINKIKLALKDVICQNNSIDLRLEKIGSIDITGVQLLYSIFNSFRESPQKLKFSINLSPELEELLAKSGFTRIGIFPAKLS